MIDGPSRWRGGFPRKGWFCTGIEDHGEPGPECEACGTVIRYLHIVSHPSHPDMVVGCVCAEHLVEGYNGSEAERALRRKRAEEAKQLRVLATFRRKLQRLDGPTLNWKASRKGGAYAKLRDGSVAVVSPDAAVWRSSFKDPDTNWHQFGHTPSIEDAKYLAAGLLRRRKQIQEALKKGYTLAEARSIVDSLDEDPAA